MDEQVELRDEGQGQDQQFGHHIRSARGTQLMGCSSAIPVEASDVFCRFVGFRCYRSSFSSALGSVGREECAESCHKDPELW